MSLTKQCSCPVCQQVFVGKEPIQSVADNAYCQLMTHFETQHPGEGHTCGRRHDWLSPGAGKEGIDFYVVHDHGEATCSYCGSLSGRRCLELLEQGGEAGPTDKNYKMYVESLEGREFKFYFPHFNAEEQQRFVDLLNQKKLKIGYPGYFYALPYFCKPVS